MGSVERLRTLSLTHDSGTLHRRANSRESMISQVPFVLTRQPSVRSFPTWPRRATSRACVSTILSNSAGSGGVAEKLERGALVSASFVGFLSPSSRLFKTHHAGEESEPHKTSGTVALLGYVQDFCPRSRLTKLYVAPV